MARKFDFDPADEEFFSKVGSFGVPKFDNEMHGGIPRGFTLIAFTDTGSGSELFAKQFTSPAEESENTLYISTNEGQAEIVRIFQKYSWPMDINVRTIGEEYNSTVLERELLASRYRLEGFQLADIQRLAQTRFVDDTNQDFLTEVTNEIMAVARQFTGGLCQTASPFSRTKDRGEVPCGGAALRGVRRNERGGGGAADAGG